MKDSLIKLYTACYDGCYAIGVLFLRSFLRVYSSVSSSAKKIFKSIATVVIYSIWNIYQGVKFLFSELVVSSKAFVNFIKHFKKMYKHSLEVGGKQLAAQNTKNLFVNYRRKILTHLSSFLSYFLPIFAVVILVLCISFFESRTYAVEVSINGNHVAFVADEGVYSTAEKLMQERIVYAQGESPYIVGKNLKVTSVSKSDVLEDPYVLCNNLIYSVTDDIKEAYGLYVDGSFEGAVENGEYLENALNSLLEENKMGIEGEVTEFTVNVEIRKGLYPQSAVIPFVNMHIKLNSDVEGERTYTAVEGDSLWSIAEKNNVTRSQLRSLNPDIEKNLWVGDTVLISKSVPFLTVQTKVTESYEVEIPYKLVSTNSSKYAYGTTKVVKAGKAGKAIETAEKIYVNGILQSTNIVNTEVLQAAVNREVIVGTYIDTTTIRPATGGFMWPVDGGYVSCGINGYRGHTGMDIAAARGTNIRASKSGVVTKVKKQTTGYGYHIMIDHGGGVQTLYAHCSKLLVKVGQRVTQGELIALVGSTGNSTGNHCHFEIRINGQYKNPANYIGTYYK